MVSMRINGPRLIKIDIDCVLRHENNIILLNCRSSEARFGREGFRHCISCCLFYQQVGRAGGYLESGCFKGTQVAGKKYFC